MLIPKVRYFTIASIILILSMVMAKLPISKQLLKITDLRIYDTIIDFHNAFINNPNKAAYDDICIVDIDEKSIAALGQHSSWPNLFYADLTNILAKDEPMAIGFDVFFTESDSIKGYARKRRLDQLGDLPIDKNTILNRLSSDAAFTEAIANAGNVYLAMFGSNDSAISPYIPSTLKNWNVKPRTYMPLGNPHPPIPEFAENAYGVGFAHIEPDVSGIIHEYPLLLGYRGKYYVNFSLQMCLDLLGIDSIAVGKRCSLFSGKNLQRELPLSPDGSLYFKYYGPQNSFRYIPFVDVLENRCPPQFFHNRIVLVGSSALGLRDNKNMPLDQNYPGVELHATIMRNILEEDYIHWLNPWIILAANILLLLALVFLIQNVKPFVGMAVFFIVTALLILAFFIIYAVGTITLPYTTILLPWIIGFIGLFITQFQEQVLEKRKVRNAFEHYVSKAVISQIMKGSHSLAVGGEKKTISIMFVDVRNFTSLCEKLSPDEITGFMNKYFNLATQQIFAHQGLLDKYIGDAVLGLFGAPVTYPDFEINAVLTGIAIRDISFALKQQHADHPVLQDFRIGVGIATGEVIVGNIGSDMIFNYTAIGDRMNFCSRLEALNKFYHTSIIIDDVTYQKVKDCFICRKLDRVTVAGKQIVTDIYEVLDLPENIDPDSALLKSYAHYETALALMHATHFTEAKDALKQALELNPTDYPSLMMLERIEMVNWESWDGVWQHEKK